MNSTSRSRSTVESLKLCSTPSSRVGAFLTIGLSPRNPALPSGPISRISLAVGWSSSTRSMRMGSPILGASTSVTIIPPTSSTLVPSGAVKVTPVSWMVPGAW